LFYAPRWYKNKINGSIEYQPVDYKGVCDFSSINNAPQSREFDPLPLEPLNMLRDATAALKGTILVFIGLFHSD